MAEPDPAQGGALAAEAVAWVAPDMALSAGPEGVSRPPPGGPLGAGGPAAPDAGVGSNASWPPAWNTGALPMGLVGLAGFMALGGSGSGSGSGSGNAGGPGSTITVSGAVVLGPARSGHGLRVQAFDVDGNLLAQANVAPDGSYSLSDISGYTGAVLVQVTDTNPDPDYIDEATGAPRDLDSSLRAVLVIGGSGNATAHVTPLSELMVRELGLTSQSNVTLGAIDARQITDIGAKVAQALGLSGVDLVASLPQAIVDANGVFDLSRANPYGVLLAALSGMEAAEGQTTDQMLSTLAGHVDTATGSLSAAGRLDLVSGARLVAQAHPNAAALFSQIGQAMGLSSAELDAIDGAWNALRTLADGVDNDGAGLSNEQFDALGVRGLDTPGARNALNDALDIKSAGEIAGRGKLQALASTVGLVQATAADRSVALTQDQLEELGVTQLTPARTQDLIRKIAASPDDGSSVDTLAELQAMVDTTAPATTVGNIGLRDAARAGDVLLTRLGEQTVSATLSAPLAAGEQLLVSLDGGTAWRDVTGSVAGTSVSWAAILQGQGSIRFKVQDAAGNDGVMASQAYRLDTQAPQLNLDAVSVDDRLNATEVLGNVIVRGTSDAEDGQEVVLTWGRVTKQAVITDGRWEASFTPGELPGEGSHTLTARGRDLVGNNATPASRTVTIDKSAPEALLNFPELITLSGGAGSNDRSAQVTALGPNGDFAVAWIATDPDQDASVLVQRFGRDGRPVGGQLSFDPDGWIGDLQMAAVGSDGAFVLVWTGGEGYEIKTYLQRVDPHGTPSPIVNLPVGDLVTSVNWRPQVTPLGTDGAFAVAWEAREGPDYLDDYSIFLQRFDELGEAEGEAIQIEPEGITQGQDNQPQITSLSSEGDLVVVWRGDDSEGDFSVFAKYVPQDGPPIAAMQLQPAGWTGINDERPRVAAAGPEGGFAVVWESTVGEDDERVVLAYVHNPTLATTVDFMVLAAPGAEALQGWSPHISPVGSSGDFVVTWVGEIRVGVLRVLVQKFTVDADGILNPNPVVVLEAPSAEAEPWEPQILPWGHQGEFIVTWSDFEGEDDEDESVYVQHFDVAGQPDGGAARLEGPSSLDGWDYGARLAALGSEQGLVAAWTGEEEEWIGDIFVQRFDTALPETTGIGFSSSKDLNGQAAAWLDAGDTLSVTLHFSEPMVVTGVPRLALDMGGTAVYASYARGSGSAELVFSYTIENGQSSSTGIRVGELSLNGGNLRDAAGNDAHLPALGAVSLSSGYKVDAAEPIASAGLRPAAILELFFPPSGAAKTVMALDNGNLLMTVMGFGFENEPLMTFVEVEPEGSFYEPLSDPWRSSFLSEMWAAYGLGLDVTQLADPDSPQAHLGFAALSVSHMESDSVALMLQTPVGEQELLTIVTDGLDRTLYFPQIEALGTDGSFAAAWLAGPILEDEPLAGSGPWTIFATRFDSNGETDPAGLWSAAIELPDHWGLSSFLVPTTFQLASIGNEGEFALVWVGKEADDDTVFLQRFGSDGRADSAPLSIDAANIADADGLPQLLDLGADGFALSWIREIDLGQVAVYVQHFPANGAPRDPVQLTPLSTLLLDADVDLPLTPPQMAALGNDGRFVVSWMSQSPDEDGSQRSSVHLQRFNADGTAQGDTMTLSSPAGIGTNSLLPKVTPLNDQGAFAVSWETTAGGVYIQRFDAQGTAEGRPTRLEFVSIEHDWISNVQLTPFGEDGSFVVSGTAYLESSDWPPPATAFVQRFNANGSTSQNTTVPQNENVWVSSSEPGMAYLVNASLGEVTEQAILLALDSRWNSQAIATANAATELSTIGLEPGDYRLYTVDQAGKISQPSEATVTIVQGGPTIDLTGNGRNVLTLSLQDVLDIGAINQFSEAAPSEVPRHQVMVLGDSRDSIRFKDLGWESNGTIEISEEIYLVWNHAQGPATVYQHENMGQMFFG